MNENMELYYIRQLERVDKWLTFAEAKNAAIIALNAAIVSKILDIIFSDNMPIVLITYNILIYIPIILLLFSLAIALYSFKPNLSKDVSNSNTQNLIFYRSIALFKSTEEYIKCIDLNYGRKESEANKCVQDLAEEIIINSRIAVNKYKMFNIALKLDLWALLFVLIVVLLA